MEWSSILLRDRVVKFLYDATLHAKVSAYGVEDSIPPSRVLYHANQRGAPHFCDPIFVMALYGGSLGTETPSSLRTDVVPTHRRTRGIAPRST